MDCRIDQLDYFSDRWFDVSTPPLPTYTVANHGATVARLLSIH